MEATALKVSAGARAVTISDDAMRIRGVVSARTAITLAHEIRSMRQLRKGLRPGERWPGSHIRVVEDGVSLFVDESPARRGEMYELSLRAVESDRQVHVTFEIGDADAAAGFARRLAAVARKISP